MHYIIGTSFSVRPDLARGFRSKENAFKVNTVYRIHQITKNTTSLKYTFSDVQGEKIIVDFTTSREADNFISKLRGEVLPDYQKIYENREADL